MQPVVLTERDALDLAADLGLSIPARVFVRDAVEARQADLSFLDGLRVVLKAVSPEVVHKTEMGAVAVVENTADEIAAAIEAMTRRLAGRHLRGFTLNRFLEHERSLGHELLLGMRWTADFGPVVTLGAGGIHAEHLARSLAPGASVAILSPALGSDREIEAAIRPTLLGPLLLDGLRGQPPLLGRERLIPLLRLWLDFAARHLPAEWSDFEVNPAVVVGHELWALDARATPGTGSVPARTTPRPVEKLDRMLRPRSIAIAGVSSRRNPGRVILENVLDEGFDPSRVRVIKPGADAIAGVPCVPSVAALPEPADLLVLSVDAATSVGMLEEAVLEKKAEGVLLISSGIGEREGTEGLASRFRAALDASRGTAWKGPLVNGGNCLGIRSLPGGYDTMFVPGSKLGRPPKEERESESPLALLSQSGAFACARASSLCGIEPRFAISIGNQIDLTAGDYMEWLAGDPGTEIVACYLEGFRPGDGERWLAAASRIVAGGRDVILYRAGRTEAGAGAAASHTASVAGDFTVLRALASQAGIVLAESIADFDDLTRIFTRLRGKRLGGMRLGGLSNAGFESVAIADSLGPMRLAAFSGETRGRLTAIFEGAKIDAIVAPNNPLDLTPMLGDDGYVEVIRAVLADPGVDAAVVATVPMTPTLSERFSDRIAALAGETDKPWVAVVDGGPLYDGFRERIERAGIPTFRSVDRATRLLGVWATARRRAEESS